MMSVHHLSQFWTPTGTLNLKIHRLLLHTMTVSQLHAEMNSNGDFHIRVEEGNMMVPNGRLMFVIPIEALVPQCMP